MRCVVLHHTYVKLVTHLDSDRDIVLLSLSDDDDDDDDDAWQYFEVA